MRLRDRWGAGKGPRTEALKRAWSRELGAFLCHYSGAVLTDDAASPWHISFDHRTPGKDADLVVCAAAINSMKGVFTDLEFRRVVVQLGERFTGKRERIETFQPTHWGSSVQPFRRA